MYLQRKINKNKQPKVTDTILLMQWFYLYICKKYLSFIEGQIYIEIKSYVHKIIILQIREDTSFLNVSTCIATMIGRGGGVIFILRRLCLLHYEGVGGWLLCLHHLKLVHFQFLIHVYVTI